VSELPAKIAEASPEITPLEVFMKDYREIAPKECKYRGLIESSNLNPNTDLLDLPIHFQENFERYMKDRRDGQHFKIQTPCYNCDMQDCSHKVEKGDFKHRYVRFNPELRKWEFYVDYHYKQHIEKSKNKNSKSK